MRPGDIMVAIGTDFDLIEIMNMSGGIITEEGGLLSHASVVSRELNKPCLIGVSNATKEFKDGDFVTLNATDGTITLGKNGKAKH
jgi:phosphohistidine swiveling domain-containing protein